MSHHRAGLQNGSVIIQVIIFGTISALLIAGFARWGGLQIKAARQTFDRDQAFTIAEAGIEYYRWHLAHEPQDFSDGTCTPGPCAPGPYIHDFFDKDGNHIGTFRLTITPPLTGSTKTTILSEGRVDTDASIKRQVRVKMGIPSLARYSYVTDNNVWFGTNEPVKGLLHSNKGIRLDSSANNVVTSALVTTPTSGGGWDSSHGTVWAVHTHGNAISPGLDPAPPFPMPNPIPPLPSRPLIFNAGRKVGVTLVNFDGFTIDMNNLKTLANNGGKYFAPSGGSNKGWHLTLRTNGYDVWPVTTFAAMGASCTDSGKVAGSLSALGSWSVGNQGAKQSFVGYPVNGVFFFEDNVWVDGQVQNGRLMIAAARLGPPANSAHIIVNNNLLYTAFNETDSIGLFAEGDFLIGLKSASTLEIDAAIITKNGSTQRHYYTGGSCADKFKTKVTFNGMSASRLQGNAFAWNSPVTSGYQNVIFIYDTNLLYAPPPNFPRTATAYTTLTWESVQ